MFVSYLIIQLSIISLYSFIFECFCLTLWRCFIVCRRCGWGQILKDEAKREQYNYAIAHSEQVCSHYFLILKHRICWMDINLNLSHVKYSFWILMSSRWGFRKMNSLFKKFWYSWMFVIPSTLAWDSSYHDCRIGLD